MKTALTPLLFTLFLFVSIKVQASTLVALDLDTLALDANEIFVGEVVEARAEVRGGRIFTIHTIRVVIPISMETADSEALIEVVTAGGRTQQFAQMVLGEAELHLGETYLLFVTCRRFERVPLGLSQGAYRVSQRDDDSVLVIEPPNIGARLVAPRSGRFVDTGLWLSEPRPIGEVIEEIEAVREVGL